MTFPSLKVASALLWTAACAFAAIRGRRPERIAAVVLFTDLVVVLLLQRLNDLNGPQYVVMSGDVGVLGVLGYLAFTTDRRWLLWATGFQVTSVLTHVAEFFDRSARIWAVLTASWIWGYALIGALVAGTVLEGRAGRRDVPS